jgi:adenylosuccinate lyase
VLLALVKTGLPRQEAYVMVQRNALKAISEASSMGHIGALPGRFRELLGDDADIKPRLDAKALDDCFDLEHHLRHAPEILERALGPEPADRGAN